MGFKRPSIVVFWFYLVCRYLHEHVEQCYEKIHKNVMQSPSRATGPIGQRWCPFHQPSARHQLTLQDHVTIIIHYQCTRNENWI